MTRVSMTAEGFAGRKEDMRDALSPQFEQRSSAVRLVIAICGTSVAAEAIGTKTNAWLIISGIIRSLSPSKPALQSRT